MVNVLFFAGLKEQFGKERMMVEAGGLTIRELKNKFLSSHLASLDQAMTAINEEYADDAAVVKDGDTVAFIPPVSGG